MIKPLRKNGIQYKLRVLLKVFLIAVIPILTLGFNAFEKTPFYAWLFDIYGIESAITKRLTTQYGDPHRLIIDRERNKEEFDDLWKLILKYSVAKISRNNPKIISRLAIENGAYVTIPQKGKVILIPDTVPVFAMYCTERQLVMGDCKDEDSVMIGTVGDIKEWLQKKRQGLRSIVDVVLSLVSIILGLLLELRQTKAGV